ncbi:MAG: single-stranded DNA-binding protein [Anaerolineae bacterium]|nr:single-stranded DNA-binding protein [Anaerolineae bacterium]
MAGYQYTIIIGNVGRVDDGALAYTQSGTARFRFSVFVTRKWTDRTTNEAREKTTIFNCTAWRQLAETCAQYVRTGMQIMVTGEVDARAYTAQDGEARASLDLDVRDVQFLGSREDAREAQARDADSDRMPF